MGNVTYLICNGTGFLSVRLIFRFQSLEVLKIYSGCNCEKKNSVLCQEIKTPGYAWFQASVAK